MKTWNSTFDDKDSFEPLHLFPLPFFSPVVKVCVCVCLRRARARASTLPRRQEKRKSGKKPTPSSVSFYITGELESKRRERASMLKRPYKVP